MFFNSDNTTAERKYYNEFATNFVDLQKARKFPNGSKCFRLLAEHPEEEYIEFDPEVKLALAHLLNGRHSSLSKKWQNDSRWHDG